MFASLFLQRHCVSYVKNEIKINYRYIFLQLVEAIGKKKLQIVIKTIIVYTHKKDLTCGSQFFVAYDSKWRQFKYTHTYFFFFLYLCCAMSLSRLIRGHIDYESGDILHFNVALTHTKQKWQTNQKTQFLSTSVIAT